MFKKSFFIVLFGMLTLISVAQTDIHASIANDIKTGNITDLSSHFTDNIDISIDDIDAIYSRSQAAMILKKFFNENKVIEFKTEHTGNASQDNQYIIGKLKTDKGNYRVTYFISTTNNKSKIKQFNIESY